MRTIVIAVSLFATGALAQPVWRCGNTYGSVPCEGGALVGRPAPVSANETARARAVGKTDAALAAALEKERLKREKEAPKAVIPLAAAQPASAKAPAKKKAKEPELLTAVGAAPKKK